jgi:hypothetical protein
MNCNLCGRAAAAPFGLGEWLGSGDADCALTLCALCDEIASEWYVGEYRRWIRFAEDAIASGPAAGKLDGHARPSWTTTELRGVKPARFLKAALTMLLAIAPPGLVDEHPELAEHAHAPGRRGLPPRYQLYLALFHGPRPRVVDYSAQLDTRSGRPVELLELAHPPFSCVLSLNGEAQIETTNISEFAELAIDEACIVDLDLLNGFGHTPFPADFRTRAAVERDREADRRAA